MAGLMRLEEANSLAREATARFPLLAKLWLDLAQILQGMGNADGRIEALAEVRDDLTMAGNMDVISRTSAFAFKQRKNDVRRIGKYLNIDAVLEGSVQQVSQVVRIKARLVNAHTGFTLWTTTFDVKSGNPLAMQKHISDAIVPDVRSLLSPTS